MSSLAQFLLSDGRVDTQVVSFVTKTRQLDSVVGLSKLSDER